MVGKCVNPPTVIAIGCVCRPPITADRSPASFLSRSARSTASGAICTKGMTQPTSSMSGATSM